MMQDLQRTLLRLWQQLSWAQRIAAVGLTSATVGAIALLVMWASAPTYGVLFSGLSNQDAGSIMSQLDANKVPYQLANGGTTIMVPQSMVDSERLRLASQGLPQDGVVGFSLFDKTSIFQGDSFTEQINYTRALEGELTRTIGQISGVIYDKVNIVLPQQELFSSQQASPTASVLLKLGPGNALSNDQITGIQHLVASAVQGLKPDGVTVVDGNGTILSNNVAAGDMGAMGMTALQAQQRYASNLQAQLVAMLNSVLGPDHAVVRVQAQLDWTQRESTANTYAPQDPTSPVSSSHTAENRVQGPNAGAGGVAGLGSNVPTYGSVLSTTTPYTQTQRVVDVTFANSITSTHIVAPPGTVSRLSIAVLLDGITNPTEIATLRQAVSDAAGLLPARGDQLSIASVPFDTSAATAAEQAAAAQQQRDLILSIVRWAALIIVPLVLLFLLRRLLVPAGTRKALQRYDPGAFPTDVQVVEQADPLLNTANTVVSLPGGAQAVLRESLTELAREKPEILAGLIGRWMEEDRA